MSISWISFLTIFRKEVKRFMRIWTQTILPSAITMTLYFVIFGTFIGSRISQIGDYSYIQFIAPGLIMMAVINNSYSNVVSSFFGSKFQRNVEELLVSPTPSSIIILGYISAGVLRGLIVGLLVSIVSLFFTKLVIFNIWIIIIYVVLTSVVFSLAGLLNGLFARRFDDVAIVPTFVLTPLTYLGGVFYSISVLPEFWQNISKINPILYMVSGFRYGFLGISDINVWLGMGMLILFTLVLFSVNLVLIRKGYGLRS
ncbi:ABC transporter permease [Candidatus Woesearchaeota archaeon]|jgi:ABC-2 type transport system permease protein|nr:ABC transporter permease [Candidatus Woesearchaeota archaeon]MBT5740410.1 ABC transporter permease [Candidatus Woesearchaeota archaeon]